MVRRFVPDDACHAAAATFLRSNDESLVTTDYILDELLTLLNARGHSARADSFIPQLLSGVGEVSRLEWVSQEDVIQAWLIFQRHREQAWSFRDCVSLAVMNRLGIKAAFAFDEHFRQFAGVSVLP